MSILTKPYGIETVIPEPTQEYVPGYSYFKDSYNAQLTLAGRTYIAAVFNARGYSRAGNQLITANSLVQAFTGRIDLNYAINFPVLSYTCNYYESPYEIFINGSPVTIAAGWTVTLHTGYLYKNGVLLPADGNDWSHYTVTTENSYFDTPPDGKTINIPGRYETVTPEPYEQEVPLIGWTGGAVSSPILPEPCVAKFSLALNNVGVFVGVCEQSIAWVDQRYEQIKFAIYSHLGYYSVYVNNIKKTEDDSYNLSDVFKIVVSKNVVAFYKNGIEIYSELKDSNSIYYVLDSSLYYSNDAIYNASFKSYMGNSNYSSLSGTRDNIGNLISLNYSSIIGLGRHAGFLKTSPKLTFENTHDTTLVSFNYSVIGSERVHITNLLNYPSRIESNQTHICLLLSKYGSIINGSNTHSSLLEAGGVIPTIPPNIISTQLHTGFMRNVFILPPQVFIIT